VAVTVVEGAVKEPVSSAERIAFVSAGYIHLISPEGKDEIRLTEGERPVWSPDGEKIAYMLVTRSGEDGLYLINRDGTNKIKVAKMVTITGREYIDIDILGYSWSPDGREIAFTRKSILAHPELSQPGIYLVNADGTNLHRLSEESSLDVSFSPDGSRIAYIGMGKEDEDYYLYIINADGEGKTKLSPIPTGPIHVYSRNLTWSRQGMIAYVDGDANLFVITPPGRPMKLDENAGYPSWSPDGGKIAYLKPVYGEASLRPSLYIANPDGTGKTELATFTAPDSFNFSAPSWSPDGRKIVFSPGERIYIVSLDNGAKTGLTYGLSPQWAPAAMGVSLERGEERGEMLGDCAVMIQPGESIQAVIDTAEEGAVICLAEGTWEENIVIKKSLTLQGTGQEKPIIKGLKEGEPVILIISAEEIKVTVKGLTIAEAGKFCAGGQLHCSHGFSLGGKAKVTIEGNTISENADGIYIQDSARATITGNTISGHGDGILMEDSAQATITGNTISRNGIGIYISDAAQATIQGNTISGNGWDGIWIRASAQATILKNTISRNGYDGGQGGIVMADSAQATIQGNTISENRGINIMDGIVMADSARATITGNTISSHTGNGIIINFSAQATITENTISRNNGNGILMENSAQATITENTISENGSGIFMEDLKIQATIQGNKITDNERYGVMLEVMLEHYAHGYPPGQVFSGRVRGGSNAISRNIKGDVYPSPELDFLMTEEGGCYGHLC
jgi:parallel beta-helix repeat protein